MKKAVKWDESADEAQSVETAMEVAGWLAEDLKAIPVCRLARSAKARALALELVGEMKASVSRAIELLREEMQPLVR